MKKSYLSGFLPYALSASLIGLVGGFSTILGPAFVRDMELDYVNTTWTALAQAMSTAACAPVLGKLGDVLGRWTTLLAGLLLFMLGNILTALSPSLGVMLLARFLVGIGTAAITPVGLYRHGFSAGQNRPGILSVYAHFQSVRNFWTYVGWSYRCRLGLAEHDVALQRSQRSRISHLPCSGRQKYSPGRFSREF